MRLREVNKELMSYIVYLAQRNSDLTEGRGRSVNIAAFSSKADATRAARGWGVMGVGDGDVKTLEVFSTFDEYGNEQDEKVRRQALAKLTPEEQRSLGL